MSGMRFKDFANISMDPDDRAYTIAVREAEEAKLQAFLEGNPAYLQIERQTYENTFRRAQREFAEQYALATKKLRAS